MSVQATTAVWEHSKAKGPDLVTMLAIADAANADGRNAFPGMPRLERYLRKDKRNVLASIRRCIKRGELERVQDAHRGQVAIYDVVLPGLAKGDANDTQTDPERVTKSTPKGDDISAKGDDFPPPLLIKNHEPNNKGRARGERARVEGHPFADFWQLYPKRSGRRLGRDRAEDAWKKLGEADQFRAMVGVRVYAGACERGETLAKDAYRWLRPGVFDEWAELAGRTGDPSRDRAPLPECEHGYTLVAHCPDCEAAGIPHAERKAVA